ncbi:soluble lytic murein transglycosylase-like protein [Rhizobium aethiopicum]|uniref:transglycosylase SLT domain-containing protein n=1 Tax=Rhizobium aethiopicum TaxID=1138170 RepID=UPI0017B96986|nr:transglycosylase SLT domain-containing protein [Rhizobium aethiopicum]MBB4581588.1 soluble lytic murein transglycosylase-like protein [Rhizobium aethiopicum]
MSSFYVRREKYSHKILHVASASALATVLSANIQESRAEVFEQTCNGQVIALGGGARSGAPLHLQKVSSGGADKAAPSSIIDFGPSTEADDPVVSAGATLAADVPPSSICADAPAGTASKGLLALKAIGETLSLPAPRRLSQELTDTQLEMRELAAKVGSEFADAPAVAEAKLDEPAFVKLFTTLVHRESNFRPRAVSPAGAKGLGQLMPATARHLGVKDTFAPKENLVGAATYLTEMLDQFGSPELALAAYNAGPDAVAKYGGIPPYRETRQYVSDIFHEVLREPVAAEEKPELTNVARRGLAALAVETVPAETGDTPFNIVLAEKAEQQPQSHLGGLLAFAGTAEAATLTDASLDPDGEAAAPTVTKAAAGTDKAAKPDEKPAMAEGVAPGSAQITTAVQPSPDLSTLPEPREFGEGLTKSQMAIRELTIDTALRHAKAPGVAKAELSEEEFVTLFVALIRRESSFNRRAVSPDGAKGLGQLTPKTVRELGLKNPFAAEENLEASAKRLTRLLEQFGSPPLALAAYNAGEDALTDRTVIPQERRTRQLVADVLYDLKNDPRPAFVLARFETAGRTVVATAEASSQNRVPAGPAGLEIVTAASPVVVQQSVGASASSPALADASFFDELLVALKWAVSEITQVLQAVFSGGPQDAVRSASSVGRLWHAPAANRTAVTGPVPVAAALAPADSGLVSRFDGTAALGAASSGPALPTPRIPERLDAFGEPPVKEAAVKPAKNRNSRPAKQNGKRSRRTLSRLTSLRRRARKKTRDFKYSIGEGI